MEIQSGHSELSVTSQVSAIEGCPLNGVPLYVYSTNNMITYTSKKTSFVIRGEPERAPNTRETGSGVYIYIYIYLFIYLCMILQGNDSMRMLRYHVVDFTMTDKDRHQRRSKVKSAESWQCSVVAQAQGP